MSEDSPDDGTEYGLSEFQSSDESTGADTSEWGSDDGGDGVPEWSGGDPSAPVDGTAATPADDDGALLDPESMVDDTLTVVAGIVAGIIIGVMGTFALLVATASVAVGLGLGAVAWLGSTAYLVRRRSVVGAVSHGAYGIAIVLLLVPLVMLSPAVDGAGIDDRLTSFLGLLVSVAIPAGIAAAVGYVVSQFDPTDGGSEQ